jgi:uncharacterized protein YjaZ
MSIKIQIDNTADNLTEYSALFNKVVLSTIKKVKQKININKIKIVIKESEHPEKIKSLGGIGGYCPSGHYVELDIDVHNRQFIASPEKLIETVLIHEFHHALRNQAGIRISKSTFLENLISEGLADYFVWQVTGHWSKWIIPLSKKTKKMLLTKARKIFTRKISSTIYNDWFITGNRKKNIPKWAGYVIGLDMVRFYFKNHPCQTMQSLISMPAKKIVEAHNG